MVYNDIMDEKMDKTQDMDLSWKEKSVLYNYFSSESYKINEKLREDLTMDEEEKDFVKTLSGILKKTPRVDGRDLVRDLVLYSPESVEQFAKMFNVGEDYKTNQFWSTTTHSMYNDYANVRIIIKNATLARDVRPLETKHEGEVIYEIGSEFTVTAKENAQNEQGGDMILITLKEKGS